MSTCRLEEEVGRVKVLGCRANSLATKMLLYIQSRISKGIVGSVVSDVITTVCSGRVGDGPLSISEREWTETLEVVTR